jgi:hypothetical protein
MFEGEKKWGKGYSEAKEKHDTMKHCAAQVHI